MSEVLFCADFPYINKNVNTYAIILDTEYYSQVSVVIPLLSFVQNDMWLKSFCHYLKSYLRIQYVEKMQRTS